MRIAHKLILGSLLLASMIWVVGFYAVSVSRESLKSAIEESSATLAVGILDSADNLIHEAMEDWEVHGERPEIRQALLDSNAQFAKMPDVSSHVDREDRLWRRAGDDTANPFRKSILANGVSRYLTETVGSIKEHHGHQVFREVFVTNRYGAIVGATGRTSDYRQDDERWWQVARTRGYYVEDVEYDASVGAYAVSLCVRIEDAQGRFIGVIKAVLDLQGIVGILHQAAGADQGGPDDDHDDHGDGQGTADDREFALVLLSADGKVLFTSRDEAVGPKDNIFYPSPIQRPGDRQTTTFERDDAEMGRILATCAFSDGYDHYEGLGWVLVLEHREDEIFAPVASLRSGILYLSLGVTAVGLLLGVGMSVSIGRRMRRLRDAAVATGKGDYSHRTGDTRRDEIGRVAKALDTMAETLQANRDRIEQTDWVKTGQTELNETLRGQEDLDALLSATVTYLAKYLGARVGAIYLADGERLSLAGSYAYQSPTGLAGAFAFGEGLVGQAALERRRIVLTRVPADYVAVTSGLGSAAPTNIVILPLVLEGDVLAVLELGSLEAFTDVQMSFLDQVAEGLAVTIGSVQSGRQVRELLGRTQAQSEELQAQQEHLRQSNEDLEEQTEALQQSEERLRTQQEELEESNQQLEGRTEALERERDQVHRTNLKLEDAGRDIEEKARQVEMTSRYKSEFLANMSHELRTPLNSLLILAKLLADNTDGNLTDKQISFAKTIHGSGSDLLDLINEILDLSKVEAGRMELVVENVSLSDFLIAMERRFAHVAEQKGLEFTTELGGGLPASIRTDPQRLGQVVKNLLSNALKFTAAGRVHVRIERPEPGEGIDPTRTVAIRVIDTGIGIPSEKQRVIFEAFKQADGTTGRRYGGTGLGLSISRELAGLLGGEIRLQSQEAEGSCFTLLLPEVCPVGADVGEPASSEPTSELAGPETPAPASAGATNRPDPSRSVSAAGVEGILDDRHKIEPGQKSILVIEDDMAFARSLVELARQQGFKCLVAGDGEAGLYLADHYLPSGILLDIGLPGMDGLAVMSRLKENLQTRHIPVHLISGREQEPDARRLGAVGYLRKPVSPEQMAEAFGRIEGLTIGSARKLLVVEDDPSTLRTIRDLLGSDDLDIRAASSAAEAIEALRGESFDCMILDLTLPDGSGCGLLERIRAEGCGPHVPVIVFTGKDLTSAERLSLDQYAERVVLKGDKAPERLVDETALFLHRVEKDLPDAQRRMIHMLHDKEAIFKGKTVMIMDDDMRNTFALSSVLEDKGLKLRVAKNGRDGIEQLQADPAVDLVLMDIMMPEMDGYEAMRRLRQEQRFEDLPIIALTARAMKGDRARCIEAGANDYLAKPVDTTKLLSMLRVWLYQ